MHEFTRMSVNEGFEPSASFIILNLDDMSESQGVVFFCDELEGGRVFVELSVQGALRLGNGVIEGN